MGLKSGLLLLLAMRAASAEIITSTFGPNDAFFTFVGYQIGGGSAGAPEELAVPFTPTRDEAFTQIRLAVFATSDPQGDRDLVVDLSTGSVPGTPIETFATTVSTSPTGSIYTFDSVRYPELLAGQTYWVTLSSNDLIDNFYGWDISNLHGVIAERSPGLSL